MCSGVESLTLRLVWSAGKGPAKDNGKGKKEIYKSWSNSAPTALNLPHNSFVHPVAVRDKKNEERHRQEEKAASGNSESARAALRRASKDGDVDAIGQLIDGGVHVNAILDSYDFTGLHYAAWQGRTRAVYELIKRGAAIDARNRDMKTPLHLCAGNGKARIVRELVRQGASLTVKDRDGQTPLDIAELWGNVEAGVALRQAAHEQLNGRKWRAQSANKLEQPLRMASNKLDGVKDDWKVHHGFGCHPKHHLSVQRVGVHPCTETFLR